MAAIDRLDAYVYKNETMRHLDNEARPIPGTDYYLDRFDHAYSRNLESLLVRVETDDGLVGWGEVQSPVAPEVPATLLETLLGPALLGADPTDRAALRDRLYRMQEVRGQTMGVVMDVIAGLDIALHDLAGKRRGAPVSELLGGRRRDRLPTYASGLRAETIEEQIALGRERLEEGFDGVKLYLNGDPDDELERVAAIREGLGEDARLFSDLFWAYDVPAAARLGEQLWDLDVEWMESPLPSEALDGHARLARRVDIPVAVGEPFRTRANFRGWFERGAIDVAQPDVGRTGVIEGQRIAHVADAHDIPIAPHLGGSLGVAIAATWHLAASIPNLHVQEFQRGWFDASNEFLDPGIEVRDGSAVVPDGPGLGIRVDEDALEEYVAETYAVTR